MNIPNFQNVQFVDRNGYLTDTWQLLLQTLFNQLQVNAGNEGIVAPTQNATNITTIQNHTDASGSKTTQYGTILYDSTANSIRIAVDDGAGAPLFKTVTLT